MEESHASPTEVDSDQGDRGYVTNMIYLSKKRKFHPEQFDLPIPKHKCCEHKCDSSFSKTLEVEYCGSRTSGITNKGESSDDLKSESVQDTDGFDSDPDATMCLYGSGDSELNCARKYAYDQPSPLVFEWKVNGKEKSKYNPHTQMVANLKCYSLENVFQTNENLEDKLLEFGNSADFGGIDDGEDTTEQCEEKELLDTMYPSAVNANKYVLSSGRWKINQDAEFQLDLRKPTIDEEFEQYFSALMLE